MQRVKRIDLEQTLEQYKVRRLVGSIEYNIGDTLNREEVNHLCAMPEWTVIITVPR
jgi:hypothetical protein